MQARGIQVPARSTLKNQHEEVGVAGRRRGIHLRAHRAHEQDH